MQLPTPLPAGRDREDVELGGRGRVGRVQRSPPRTAQRSPVIFNQIRRFGSCCCWCHLFDNLRRLLDFFPIIFFRTSFGTGQYFSSKLEYVC